MDLSERLTSKGPKRILALDGGGIRGVISLCFLEKIEQLLRHRHGRPRLKLCEYFDLIGGTSTGAIIAAALAMGKGVSQIKQLYLTLGKEIFRKKKRKIWESLYDEKPLMEGLLRTFGDRTLGDASIRTGLCIVTKRADTNSIWPLINHPNARYYEENRNFRLRDVVHASAAAPLFFIPARIEIEPGNPGTFVDGGVSTANNPALQLFLVATLKGFPFQWTIGEKKLLLVSVGTGKWQWNIDSTAMAKEKMWAWLGHLPKMFIQDTCSQGELLLQYLSRSQTPWEIDSEVGDLSQDLLTPKPALTYLRYNVRLEHTLLEGLGLHELVPRLEALRRLSGSDTAADLATIGELSAELQVKDSHFPKTFDPA
jgi:hypothetical protein